MEKIVSEINQLGKLHVQLVESRNIDTILSQMNSSIEPISLNNIDSLNYLSNGKGLYLFLAKFPFRDYESLVEFGSKWGVMQDKNAPANCPRFHKGNSKLKTIRNILKKNDFIPFYLGKSENLKKRIIEHITVDIDKTVYALKLISRKKIIENIDFHIGYVDFAINDSSYFCIELLENEIRKIYRPIIGKQ